MSSPLKQVIQHLQALRRKLQGLESENDWRTVIEKRREITEQFANADPSIMVMPAGVIERPVDKATSVHAPHSSWSPGIEGH